MLPNPERKDAAERKVHWIIDNRMNQSTLFTDLNISGNFTCKGFKAPDGSITNAAIQTAAGIDPTKIASFQFPIRVSSPGTVVTKTEICHVANAAGVIVGIEVFIDTHPTSSDTIVLDCLKSASGGGAFASVLSSTVTLNSSTATRSVTSATVSSPSYSAGDTLEFSITATGSSGSGLCAVLFLRENPV